MTILMSAITLLSDHDLLAAVQRAAADERRATANLISLLIELDARKLYLGEGCSSLFTYCTQVLHLSEHAAYNRIEAARAARIFPSVLTHLAEGALTLTAARLLAPHLTPENHEEVLEAARHKSKREVEQLVAKLHPRPDVPAVIRKLPGPKAVTLVPETPLQTTLTGAVPGCAGGVDAIPITSVTQPHYRAATLMPVPKPGAAEVEPLAPERYRIQFTVSGETYDRLRRAQDLLRHQIPNGDPAAIFERALEVLIKELSKTKWAAVARPRAATESALRSRHIPAAVKRAVWQRDGGRCAFTGARGRCGETGFLEFHHLVPYAAGGETSVENVQIRCRQHNAFELERDFPKCKLPLDFDDHDEP